MIRKFKYKVLRYLLCWLVDNEMQQWERWRLKTNKTTAYVTISLYPDDSGEESYDQWL